MPAKGSTLKHGNRDYIFGPKFFKKLKEKNPVLSLTYSQASEVIRHANKVIAQVIENEDDGFKLPHGLGYICAVKYIPTNPMIDWPNTHKHFPRTMPGNEGKFVYHTNFHTFGYSPKISWFRVGRITNSALNETWKFKATTHLSKAVSKAFAGGKQYQELTYADFIEKSRLENLYNKKYRKELKE